jgi:hypothetical protein
MLMQLCNAGIGIACIYAAILHPVYVEDVRWAAAVIGVGVVVCLLALASRRNTAERWQADVVLVLGLALMVQGGVRFALPMPALVDIWFVFWAGIVISVLSLWAMLYRPSSASADMESLGE